MAWLERKARSAGFVIMEFLGSGEKIRGQERKSTKRWTPVSEAAAVEKAAALGCVDPQSVEVIPFLPPSEKQQRYAADLGVRLPEGCTVVDATALISRAEIGDDQDPAPGLVEYAQSCGVCFSTFAGEGGLLDCMVCQLPIREKAILFAHAVAASVSGIRSGGSSKSSAVFEVLPVCRSGGGGSCSCKVSRGPRSLRLPEAKHEIEGI